MPQAVLVVDDDPFVRICTSRMVLDCGFDVVEAGDAQEGLGHLANEVDRIVMVITDVRMPGELDGVDFANWVAENCPKIRVLVTSGFDDGRRASLAAGVQFRPKPLLAVDLITCLTGTRA